MVAEFLALVDVRDVDFDNRRFEGIQRVEDRNRRMCERGRIDYDATRNVSCFMNPVDDLVFTVRLVEAKFKSVLFGNLAAIGLDIGKSLVTVDVRLAFAEEIEIGTIQYVDDTTHNWLRISMLGWYQLPLHSSRKPVGLHLCPDLRHIVPKHDDVVLLSASNRARARRRRYIRPP